MKNNQKGRRGTVFLLLLMLAGSPLTVNFSQIEAYETTDISKSVDLEDGKVVRTILSEKLDEGKLELKFYGISGNLSNNEVIELLTSDPSISKWAFLEGKKFSSGIILYNGKSIQFDQGSTISKELGDISYQIIFSGKGPKSGGNYFVALVKDAEFKSQEQNLRMYSTGLLSELSGKTNSVR